MYMHRTLWLGFPEFFAQLDEILPHMAKMRARIINSGSGCLFIFSAKYRKLVVPLNEPPFPSQ